MFLDILNDSSSTKVVTSVHRKPTYTNLLTNFNSFTSPNPKKGFTETLIGRKFLINCTGSGFHYDIFFSVNMDYTLNRKYNNYSSPFDISDQMGEKRKI